MRPTTRILYRDSRWPALVAVCFGVLMIVLDSSIVNVALPSIRQDFKFTETSLVWVVNAYMLSFSGSLLLGGRLGDLYGHRRVFLAGIFLFTLASLGCGLATTTALLVAARAVQGLGGAAVVAVALSLIINMFADGTERAKALGVYGFVSSGGGSIGLLLGGVLTSSLSWHWIFLVNLPIGVAVYALCHSLLPKVRASAADGRLDNWGAATVTTSLVLAVYAVVNSTEVALTSARTLGVLGCSVTLFAVFLMIEARVSAPLMPLRIFRLRSLSISIAVGVLWSVGTFAWYFTSALYMQVVLGYGPMQVGLAFLPPNIIQAAFSLGLSSRNIARFGIKKPIVFGLLLATLGLVLLAWARVDGGIIKNVLPSMILLGLGSSIAFNPLLLAAMKDVPPSESGLASGIVNTAFMMGGALGLAILASISVARSNHLLAAGATTSVSLLGGYHLAFLLGAASVGIAALIAGIALRVESHKPIQVQPRGAQVAHDSAV